MVNPNYQLNPLGISLGSNTKLIGVIGLLKQVLNGFNYIFNVFSIIIFKTFDPPKTSQNTPKHTPNTTIWKQKK